MTVKREWEETRVRTPETHKGSDIVASNTRGTRFRVRDATGAIDGQNVVSTFQPGEPSGAVLTFKGFSIGLGGFAASGGRRTLGYRYDETILPVGAQVYVLGEAADAGSAAGVLAFAAAAGAAAGVILLVLTVLGIIGR